MKFKIPFCLVFIVALLAQAQDGLELKIGSNFIKYYPKDSIVSLSVSWTLLNTGKDTLHNLDELWYSMVDNVTSGIGNTRIIVTQKDTTFLCDHLPMMVDILATSFKRFTLFPGKVKKGSEGGIFKIPRLGIDSLEIQVEYDTRFQKDGGKPLWRGKILSNKLTLKIPHMKYNILIK
jgi:hypothetical protein